MMLRISRFSLRDSRINEQEKDGDDYLSTGPPAGDKRE